MSSTLLLLGKGILVVLLFVAAGNPVVCLTRCLRSRPWYSRWAYAYLLGIVIVCSSVFAASQWLSIPIQRTPINSLLAILAFCGIGAEIVRHRFSDDGQVPRPSRALPWWIGFFLVLLILIPALSLLLDAAVDPIRDIDGRHIWVPKARYIREAGTVLPEVLREKRWVVEHPRYPPLMPLAQVVTLEVTRGADERVIRILYAAFWLVWVLIILDQARILGGRRIAALILALAACVPFVAFAFNGGAAGAYSDLPLACFWGAGIWLLLASKDRQGSTLAAGLLLTGTVLTKNEGLGLAVLALVVGLIACLGKKEAFLQWIKTLIPVLLALALLGSWKNGIPNRRDESYFSKLSLESMSEGLTRLVAEGIPAALGTMMDVRWWSLLWIVLALLLLFGAKGLKDRRAMIVALLVVGGLAQFLVAYLVTGWNVSHLVRVTWNRALLQVSVPLLALAAMAAKSVPWRDSLSYRFFGGERASRGPASAWIDLLKLSILIHVALGCVMMMGSSTDRLKHAIENSGQGYSEARRRLLGEYSHGLETIQLTIPESGSYFIANSTKSTSWIVIAGDLAPRKAHFVKDPSKFQQRWQKGEWVRDLKWTVVFRGLDKEPLVLPTPKYLSSPEALNPED